MNSRMAVGFSQRIQLDWLERTAGLLLLGKGPRDIQEFLEEYLKGALSVGGDADRNNRAKAITILLKIWVTAPPALVGLRDDALACFDRATVSGRLLLHWGLASAAYPFMGAVAGVVGRLIRLQGTLTAAQVQRRIREQLGERETVARATRRLLRSFIDWGVLGETNEAGTYQGAPPRAITDETLAVWAVEACLRATGASAGSLDAILQAPALFPFNLPALRPQALKGNRRLEFFRQGLHEEMVTLRQRRTAG